MTSKIDQDIIDFLENRKPTKVSLQPLLAHAVLNYISASEIHKHFKEKGHKISLVSVRRWRHEIANWMGLGQSGGGRPGLGKERGLRNAWHRVNGYPTLKDFSAGWIPTLISESEMNNESSSMKTPSLPKNDKPKPTQETTPKSPAERPPKTARKSAKKRPEAMGKQPPKIDPSNVKKTETKKAVAVGDANLN